MRLVGEEVQMGRDVGVVGVYLFTQAMGYFWYYVKYYNKIIPLSKLIIMLAYLADHWRYRLSPLSCLWVWQLSVLMLLESLFSSSVTFCSLFKCRIRKFTLKLNILFPMAESQKEFVFEGWLQHTKWCFYIMSFLLNFTKWLVTDYDWATRHKRTQKTNGLGMLIHNTLRMEIILVETLCIWTRATRSSVFRSRGKKMPLEKAPKACLVIGGVAPCPLPQAFSSL